MSKSLEILSTVLPVIIVLALGMLCRRKQILSREGINSIKNLVVNITLPAVLLGAFATTPYKLKELILPVMMFIVCIAAWYLGRVLQKRLNMDSVYVPYITTGFEAGMLGYALYTMLRGDGGVAEFAKIDLGQVLFVFTMYKFMLGMESGKKTDSKRLIKEMITSPIIAAVVAGLIIGSTGIYNALIPSGAAQVFDNCVDFVSGPTGALILLTIGYDLVLKDVVWKDTLKIVGLRFAIMMVLMAISIIIVKLVFPGSSYGVALAVMFILPPPFVLQVFADDESQRAYISSALSVSTLLSIIGFAVLAVIV